MGAYSYDPYGAVQTHTGTAISALGYTGQYTDPTGLIYLRARYYDPATAQMTSVDAMVDQTRTPYAYADGNPLTVSDPSGLIGCSSFTTFWGLDLCQSVSIVENEAIGVAKAAGDTASAVVHPVRTWQAWDSACQAGLNGPGGLLQCIDNVNPFGAGGVRGQIQQTWNDLNNGCPSQVGQDIGTLQFEAALSYGGGAAAAKVAERLKLLKARVNEMKAVRAADKAAKAAESVSAKVADKFNRVRAIAKDHGLNVPEFGGGYLWANKDANLALQTPEQLAEVKARGFTKSEIKTIRDYYRAVDSASTGTNPSAGYRAQLMQYYLDNWRK